MQLFWIIVGWGVGRVLDYYANQPATGGPPGAVGGGGGGGIPYDCTGCYHPMDHGY